MIKSNTGKIYGFNAPKIVSDSSGKVYKGVAFLAETEAIYTRARTEGFGVPDIHIKKKINALIYNLKCAGLWSKLACLYWGAYNSGTSLTNFRRINLRNPSGTLAVHYGGVTLTNYGWLGNALNGYVDTGFNLSLHGGGLYTQNNASIGAVVYQATAIGGSNAGIWSTLSQITTVVNGTASGQKINSNVMLSVGRSFSGTGLKLHVRNDANNVSFYPTNTTATQASVAVVSENLNLLFGGTSSYSDVGVSCVFAGSAMVIEEYRLIQSIFNNFFASLNLNKVA